MITKYGNGAVVQMGTVFETRLPCFLSKGTLKRDFLDIYLTTFFGVRNFENKSAMRVIFFLKMFQI